MISVKVPDKQIKEIRGMLHGLPKALPKVIVRAINKVANKSKTFIIRRITKAVAIKQADLRRRNVRMTRATWSRWLARIVVSGGRIPLTKFGARQTKRGVTYRIQRGGKRGRIERGFIARMPSGHEGVFVRQRSRGRLPIGEARGPSVPAVMENIPELQPGALDEKASADLEIEVVRQADIFLERRRRWVSP